MKISQLVYTLPVLATVVFAAPTDQPVELESLARRAFDHGVSELIGTLKTKESIKSSDNKEPPEQKDPEEDTTPTISPCAAIYPLTSAFYDLSDLSSIGKENIVGWNARGHDYNKNFTLGICSSPLKSNVDVNSNNDRLKLNSSEVGAFYTDDKGDKFSIGDFSTVPVFRGKKLTLTYENGSYCPNGSDRKSTILSFSCDREILQKAQISFVGVLHDCDYFFEVKTVHACATAQKADNLAVIWIFLFILLAALFVYCSGGFLYKRIVLNRRGWRQLPSYNLGSKVTSALSGGLKRGSTNRSSHLAGIRMGNNGNRFGFVEDQNNLLDSLDVDSE